MRRILVLLSVISIIVLGSMTISCAAEAVEEAVVEEAEEEAVVEEEAEEEAVVEEEIEIDPIAYRNSVLETLGVDTEVYAEFMEAVANPSEKFTGDLGKTIKIGFSTPSFDVSDAWLRYYKAMELRFIEAGVPFEMNIQAADMTSPDVQMAQIEDLISAGMDYIVFGPTELDLHHETIRKVHQAGIPLIVLNYLEPIPGDDETLMYTAFDHNYGGYLIGKHIVEWSGGTGQLAGLRMVPGSLDDQRWGGAMAVIEKTDIEVVFETYAEADKQKGFDATMDIMTGFPDVSMIYAVTSAMALGAANALDSLGLTGTVGVWGFGGTIEEINAMLEGTMTGSVYRFQDDGGVAAAEAILRHLEGRADRIPSSFMGEMEMATSDMSYDDFVRLANTAYRYTGDELGTGLE